MKKIRFFLFFSFFLSFLTNIQAQNLCDFEEPEEHQQDYPMEDFVGVNLRRQDPISYLDCAGFVREYHNWDIDEGNIFKNIPNLLASPEYPNNIYKFENGYQNQTFENFPEFYTKIRANLDNSTSFPPIASSMNGCLPRIVGGNADHFQDFKPVYNNNSVTGNNDSYPNLSPSDYCVDAATNSPYSYEHYADWVYNFTLAFGNGIVIPLHTKQPAVNPINNTNRVGYIEIWNEQDKTWRNGFDNCDPSPAGCDSGCPGADAPGDEIDMAYFTPGEYAAMASVAFDGHCGFVDGTDGTGGPTYEIGVNTADPNMKYVFGGLQEFGDEEIQYVQDVINIYKNVDTDGDGTGDGLWNRTLCTNAADVFPFDVINFHHYSDGNWEGVNAENNMTFGLSPEDDTYQGISFKEQLVKVRQQVDIWEDDLNKPLELWMSEFGYDTNDNSDISVPTMAANGNEPFLGQQEVQARWLVRTYLEIASAGWDRAMQFCIRDEATGADEMRFRSSGLVKDLANGNAPKKSYYSVHTMKDALRGTKFNRYVLDNVCSNTVSEPRVYEFTAGTEEPTIEGEVVFVAWLPTANNNSAFVDIDIPTGATQATIVRSTFGDKDGTKENLDLSGGNSSVSIKLTEDPIYIRFGDFIFNNTLVSDCSVDGNDLYSLSSLSCDAILLTRNSPTTITTALNIYYFDKSDSQELGVTPVFDPNSTDWKTYVSNLSVSNDCDEIVIAGLPKSMDEYFIHIQTLQTINPNDGEVITAACTLNASTTACANILDISGLFGAADITIIEGSTLVNDLKNHVLSLFDNRGFDLCNTENDIVAITPAPNEEAYTVDITLNSQINISALGVFDEFGSGPFSILYSSTSSGENFIPLVNDFGTFKVKEWQYFPALTCQETGFSQVVRRLRLVRSNSEGCLAKIVIYGHPVLIPFATPDCCSPADHITISASSGAPISLQNLINVGVLPPVDVPQSSAKRLRINGELLIDTDYIFGNGSSLVMRQNSKITINPNISLRVTGAVIEGCEALWQGFDLRANGVLTMESSIIRDAVVGVKVRRQQNALTTLIVNNSLFEKNWIGIEFDPYSVGGQLQNNDISSLSHIRGTVFDGLGEDLKPLTDPSLIPENLPHQNFDQRSFMGIRCSGLAMLDIGRSIDQQARRTVFKNLEYGIKASVCNLNIDEAIFEDIDKRTEFTFPTTGPYYERGCGIWSVWSNISVTGPGIESGDRTAFKNVFAPIRNIWGLHDIRDNKIEFCDNGIYALYSFPGQQKTRANSISSSSGSGLHFVFQSFGNNTIDNNDIFDFADNSPSDGIYVSSFPPLGNQNAESDITNNNIIVSNGIGSTGMRLIGVRNSDIEGNVISTTAYLNNGGDDSTFPDDARRINLIRGARLTGNSIGNNTLSGDFNPNLMPDQNCTVSAGDTWVGAADVTGMILFDSDNNPEINCNTIRKTEVAFASVGNNISEDNYRENHFIDSGVGMWIHSNGLMGVQNHTGNTWETEVPGANFFPGKAARHFSNGGTPWLASRFFVNTDSTHPPSDVLNPSQSDLSVCPVEATTSSVKWFTLDDATTDPTNCPPNLICDSPSECYEDTRTKVLTPQTGTYWKFVKGVYNFSDLPALVRWNLKRDIYETVKEEYYSTGTADSGTPLLYTTFITGLNNTDIQKFYDVDNKIGELILYTEAERSAANAKSRIVDSLRQIRSANIEAFHNLTENQQETVIANLQHDTEIFTESNSFFNTFKTKLNNQITATNNLITDNMSITPSSGAAKNEITINDIHLRTVGLDAKGISNGDWKEVIRIADLCPSEGSRAIFKARNLYMMFEPKPRVEWSKCAAGERESIEDTPLVSKESEVQLKVIPNPASNSFSFMSTEVGMPWRLSSISGQTVTLGKTSEMRTAVNVSDFSAGLYFLSVGNQTVKVVIQH